jgi:hypothetical protein
MQEIFPSTKCLSQLLASTQHPLQLLLGTLSAGVICGVKLTTHFYQCQD